MVLENDIPFLLIFWGFVSILILANQNAMCQRADATLDRPAHPQRLHERAFPSFHKNISAEVKPVISNKTKDWKTVKAKSKKE